MRISTAQAVATQPCVTAATPITCTMVTSTTRTKVMSTSDEHVIEVSRQNPDSCTSDHRCGGHDAGHVHGPGCGHDAVPHGDHVDYRVSGHLHHPHGDHCDDHGPLASA